MPQNKKALDLNLVWVPHVGSLWVLWFVPTVQKRAWVRLIGDYNLTMSVKGCLSVSAGPDWRFKTQTLDRLPIWSLGQAHTHRQPFTHIYISNLIHTRQSSLSFAL